MTIVKKHSAPHIHCSAALRSYGAGGKTLNKKWHPHQRHLTCNGIYRTRSFPLI